MIQKLRGLYDRYEKTAEEVRRKAPPAAGIFGLGEDPRNHPCHMDFYEAVEQWIGEFLTREPENAAVYEATRWVLSLAQDNRDRDIYWYCYALHGLCGDLVARLNPDQCRELMAYYDANYPKRDRLPAQRNLYKQLRKGAR